MNEPEAAPLDSPAGDPTDGPPDVLEALGDAEVSAAADDAAEPEPGSEDAGADHLEAEPAAEGDPAPPARILVLDDDRTTQRFLRYLLEKDGYVVTTVGDGVEALLAIGQGDFDLVLSDIHMPHLDGVKLLEQRARTGLRAPVVILSADGSEATVRRCLQLGAADYLRKPVKRDTLLPRVRRALGLAAPTSRA